ncbi:GNAT family N-acetyltransferase [Thalassotalea euphylliae]|uniref:GNAT family N-acetyltransferase n=1 Tax=Thalassotalea euphylliae TaxID=1655234 RepID=A0A3E0TT39_9GAMM|nr:GNAT family N-acetyltransferase [Thalassotalea euphylliae]REL27826.1 GNAT family N-acetyltransferase [Thalassotalea euphylliae]
MNYTITENPPKLEDFIALRTKVGWGNTDPLLAQMSLDNSLYHLSAYQNNQLIGMVRLVGDGALFFYIQDLVVAPVFQQTGVGKALMTKLEQHLAKVAKYGATIGLFSAQGKEAFYHQYGYVERTGEPLGLGMCKFVS